MDFLRGIGNLFKVLIAILLLIGGVLKMTAPTPAERYQQQSQQMRESLQRWEQQRLAAEEQRRQEEQRQRWQSINWKQLEDRPRFEPRLPERSETTRDAEVGPAKWPGEK